MAKVENGLGTKKPKKGLGSATELIGNEETEEYVQRAYDFYAKPYQTQFENLGEATRKEAIGKGLYLSGSLAKATDKQMDDYSRQVAENVVMPLAREGMDRSFQAQELGLREQQQAETERATRQQESFRRAELTGYISGQKYSTVSLDSLGMTTSDYNENERQNISTKFAEQLGRIPTAEEVDSIMAGEKLSIERMQTVGQQQLGEQQRQFDVTTTGKTSYGTFTANDLGVPVDLLEQANAQRVDGTIDSSSPQYLIATDIIRDNARDKDIYISDADVQKIIRGDEVDLSGAPTLDFLKLQEDREQFNASLAQDMTLSDKQRDETARQFNIQTIRRQIEWKADVTGRYGASAISAEMLGIDQSPWTDEDGNIRGDFTAMDPDEREAYNQAKEDLRRVASEAGLSISDEDADKILGSNKAITIMGETGLTMAGRQQTMAESERLYQRRNETARLQLDEDKQRLDEAITRAEQSGTYIDPVTGDSLNTLERLRLDLDNRVANWELTGEADGKDRYGNYLGSLAAEAQKQELRFGKERQELEQAIARAQQTGDFKDPDTGKTVETLEKELQTANINIQKANLRFEKQREINRQREVFAELTGVSMPVEINLEMLGGNLDEMYDKDGNVRMEYWYESADIIANNAKKLLGREPTSAEIQALIRGDSIVSGDPMDTLAKTMQEGNLTLEQTIARAEFTGFFGPDNLETLAGNRQAFEQEIQKRVQSLNEQQQAYTENMEMFRERGYMEIGEGGQITAEELGIDITYVSTLNSMSDIIDSYEAETLRNSYREMTGEELSDPDVLEMLQGRGKSISAPIRIETLSARTERQRQDIEVGKTLGELGGKKTEASRQFDEDLSLRTDLTEAEVASIYADTSRADKQMEAQITKWVAETNLDIATITGQFGISGDISAEELGVTVPSFDNDYSLYEFIGEDSPEKDALVQSFNSTFGRDPSNNEMSRLLTGASVSVESTPTLAGRQLSQLISSQSLEMANDMEKFSKQMGLERDELAEMQSQFDDTEKRLNEEMSNQFGLEKSQFALARQELEATYTGKWNVSGAITGADLGFADFDATGLTADQVNRAAESLMTSYEVLTGEKISKMKAYDVLQGGSIPADETWTQDAIETARRFGLDQDSFTQAITQYNQDFEENQRRNWASMKGYGFDPTTGKTMWTQGYAAYRDGKREMEKLNVRRDMVWNSFSQDAVDRDKKRGDHQFKMSDYRGLTKTDPQTGKTTTLSQAETVDRMVSDFEELYGYQPERQDIANYLKNISQQGEEGWAKIKTVPIYGFGTGNAFEEEMGRLNNIISGHALQIVEATSGWEQAGRAIGQTVSEAFVASQGGDGGGNKKKLIDGAKAFFTGS